MVDIYGTIQQYSYTVLYLNERDAQDEVWPTEISPKAMPKPILTVKVFDISCVLPMLYSDLCCYYDRFLLFFEPQKVEKKKLFLTSFFIF